MSFQSHSCKHYTVTLGCSKWKAHNTILQYQWPTVFLEFPYILTLSILIFLHTAIVVFLILSTFNTSWEECTSISKRTTTMPPTIFRAKRCTIFRRNRAYSAERRRFWKSSESFEGERNLFHIQRQIRAKQEKEIKKRGVTFEGSQASDLLWAASG